MTTKYSSSGNYKTWTSPTHYSYYYPSNLNDGDVGTYCRVNAQPVVYFYYDFGLDNHFIIDSFRFYNTAYGFHPSNVDILGGMSNGDGSISWTNIATNVNIPSNAGWETVNFSNTTPYRYYQLKVNAIRTPANTSTRMYEWELYGPDSQVADTSYTKVNSPSSTYTAGSSWSLRPASNAGDGDYATYWRSNGVTTEWFKADLGAGNAETITRVTMDCRAYTDVPTGFTIHGSNNNSDWTLLQTISATPNPVDVMRGEWEFIFANSTAYRYIKITFTGSTGGSNGITEFGAWISSVTTTWKKLAYSDDILTKSLFDAQTVVAAVSDNTPVAVAIAEQRILGRKTGGNIAALTAEEVLTIIGAAPASDWLVNQVF